MFKKGKKKETVKLDQDIHGLKEDDKGAIDEENTTTNLSEKVQNLFSIIDN